VFYLSQWFPERHRAVVLSRFIFGQPLALLISAALSGVILKLNGILGIAGWKWLFLIEGLPTVIIGFVTLFYLPDSPAAASWLAPSERKWLQAQIDDEHNRVEAGQRMTLWQALSHPKVIALGFVYMGLILCQASTVMFLPLMLKGLRNLSSLQIGFIAAIPYVSASIGMLIIGYSSDRARERKYHLLFSMLLVGTGSLGAALFHSNFVMTVLCVSMVTIGYFSSLPIFWMLPSAFLTGAASAGGIALISSVGNMGGFIAQTTMGWLKDLTGDYRTGLMLFASAVTLAAIVAFLVWLQIEAQRKNRNKSGECYKKATSET
jgi:ACS family tartrate transporter-like MFS transporter